MQYILKDNKTGEEYPETFKASDFHDIIEAKEAIEAGKEPTKEQAQRQINIWNRSQTNFRQEFTYRLVNDGQSDKTI